MYFRTEDLAVGYHKKALIHDINIAIEKGKILTLIGPNGSGKSTSLKTVIKQLPKRRGKIYIDGVDLDEMTNHQLAQQVAVVLTDRIRTELMTCGEVVATGRYPYTNRLGKLTRRDHEIVQESLRRVHGEELEDQDFSAISDGQRQRIMLARAICQQPQMIILDEPTAFLDIRHKIELLDILREMAQEKGITVIMSLHEIDLATKISDYVCCVKGEVISKCGPPDEIFDDQTINSLYEVSHGSYNMLMGSVELTKPEGSPKVFVVAGDGSGIPCYRALQKKEIPFATGLLYENDVDYQVAKELSDRVVSTPAFAPVEEERLRQGDSLIREASLVIDAGAWEERGNAYNRQLLRVAREADIPVIRDYPAWLKDGQHSIEAAAKAAERR